MIEVKRSARRMTTSTLPPIHGIPLVLAARDSLRLDRAAEVRLREVVTGNFELLWRSLRRFGVPEGAVDDAVQHVLLTLADRLADVDPGRERAFLLATAFRVAANVRRRHERSPEVTGAELDELSASTRTPEGLLEEKRRRLELDRVLDTLPLDQRAVFVLYELEGFTLPEIAESLGVPLGTATSRLRRARGRFEACVAARNDEGEGS